MKNKARHGLFVVFEGITSSGKSTHIKQIFKFLRAKNRKVILNDEPTKGFWGRVIRAVIESKSAPLISEIERQRLFVMDRLDDIMRTIKPNLKKGNTILQDRYELSTFAHGMANGLGFEEIDRMQKSILRADYVGPDVLIYLDVKPETAIRRLIMSGKKIDIYENLKSTAKIYENYRKLIKMKRFGKKIIIIDANKSIQKVYNTIINRLAKIIKVKI